MAVAGGGTIAGMGFTVALLVASLAFEGTELEEAKLGILGAALGAAALTWLLFRATALLPRRTRIRTLLGTSAPIVDLYSAAGARATTAAVDGLADYPTAATRSADLARAGARCAVVSFAKRAATRTTSAPNVIRKLTGGSIR